MPILSIFMIMVSVIFKTDKIDSRYGLVSVNIKPQKEYLNMNSACSACLCICEWHRRMVLLHTHTHTEVRDTRGVFSTGRLTK